MSGENGVICAVSRTNLSYYFFVGDSVEAIRSYAENILGSDKTGLRDPVRLNMSINAVLESLCIAIPERAESIRGAVEQYKGEPRTVVSYGRREQRFDEAKLKAGLLVQIAKK